MNNHVTVYLHKSKEKDNVTHYLEQDGIEL